MSSKHHTKTETDRAISVAIAYDALRNSLVRVDNYDAAELYALQSRVLKAAAKYDDHEGAAIAACNATLRAYAAYLCAILLERSQ